MRAACSALLLLAAVMPMCSRAAVAVAPGDHVHHNRLTEGARPDAVPGNLAMAMRIADECARDADAAACVAVKAAAALERAARAVGDVQLLPGLTVVKNADDGSSQRDSRALPTEDELRGQLQPGGAVADRASVLTDMVVNSGLRFLQSRTLQFKMPQTNPEELSRAIEEGRGKLKKKVLPILGLLAVKIAAVLPILLGIIGFFALKALLFGKLALLIASVLAFQKYASSSSSAGFGKIAENFGTANVASAWSQPAAPSTNGGYYRRSMDQTAQQMAYGGQIQPSVQTAA